MCRFICTISRKRSGKIIAKLPAAATSWWGVRSQGLGERGRFMVCIWETITKVCFCNDINCAEVETGVGSPSLFFFLCSWTFWWRWCEGECPAHREKLLYVPLSPTLSSSYSAGASPGPTKAQQREHKGLIGHLCEPAAWTLIRLRPSPPGLSPRCRSH